MRHMSLVWLPLMAVAMLGNLPAEESAVGEVVSEQVFLAGTWKGLMTEPLPSAKSSSTCHQDKGVTAAGAVAMAPATDDQSWADYQVPLPWSRYSGDWPNSDGEAIFRRRFSVPAAWLDKTVELHLGAIDDLDLTQVNGVTVGSTDARQPGNWAMKRVYRIPSGVLHAGDNLLCVRVFDNFGEGGLMGPKGDLYLCPMPPVTSVPAIQAGSPPANTPPGQ